MRRDHLEVPQELPVLSRGRHRNPRKGACFMELAGFLAGERWSDHPACTHPLLAGLARCVNDFTSDAGRSQLAPLVPSVIGLTSDDPHVDPRIALVCARAALPIASAERQRVLAVGIMSSERVLAGLDRLPDDHLSPESRQALASVPHATRWATKFSRDVRTSGAPGFRRYAAPRIVMCAAQGVAQACAPEPDARLRDLLELAIEETRRWVARPPQEPVDVQAWEDVCRMTRTRERARR